MSEKQDRVALLRAAAIFLGMAVAISFFRVLPSPLRILGAAWSLVFAAICVFPLFFPTCAARIKKWVIKEIDKEPVDQHMGRWVP